MGAPLIIIRPLKLPGAPNHEPMEQRAIPLVTPMGSLEPVGAPDQVPAEPHGASSGPQMVSNGIQWKNQLYPKYGSFGYHWALELLRTPEDEQIGPLGDLWRPWGSNLKVTGSPIAIWVGPQIRLFS